MTAYAILAAVAAVLGAFLGLRRKASREHDARVQAELDRDVARGRADVAEATAGEVVRVEARKDAAVEVAADYRAEVAAEVERVATAPTPAAGVPVGVNPLDRIRAADRVRAKIAGRKP